MAEVSVALPGEPRVRRIPTHPHELVMAVGALRVLVPLGLVVVLPAGIVRGGTGALTAVVVVTLVVGLFALTGTVHAWAARRSIGALQAVALGGLFVRLWVYAVVLALLHPLEVLDPVVLAVATPAVVFTLLAYEVRLVSSRPEFTFVDVTARQR